MYETNMYEGMLAETITMLGANGDVINAYYARPMGPGPFPGIVVIHHMPGWDEWYREATRKFAHHGYAALSPNLYYRAGHGAPDDVAFRSNLYWNTVGKAPTFFGKSLAEWQAAGQGRGSIVADPRFVDAPGSDFRLEPGSPALKVGFKPFDFSKAGVYGDPAWVKEAKGYVYPVLMVAPPAPPPVNNKVE